MYKSAFKLFKFSEVNGINLYFSESEYGVGFGEKLRKQVINDAFDIVKKSVQYPEIFQLVKAHFEDGTLKLQVLKNMKEAVPEKSNYIAIEG